MQPDCNTSTHDEFCSDTSPTCSTNSQYQTLCLETFFSNKCKIKFMNTDCRRPTSEGLVFETHSPHSQCHRMKSNSKLYSSCLETICNYQENTYKMINTDKVFPFEYVCTAKNQEHPIPDWGYTLICEDPSVICKKKYDCPNNCNGRGTCLENNTCFCNFFYSGELCGNYIGCPTGSSSFCPSLVSKQAIPVTQMSNDFASALNIYKNAINSGKIGTTNVPSTTVITTTNGSFTESILDGISTKDSVLISAQNDANYIDQSNDNSSNDSTVITNTSNAPDLFGTNQDNTKSFQILNWKFLHLLLVGLLLCFTNF